MRAREFIKENFDATVKMFEKQQEDQQEVITEQAKAKTVTSSVKVPASTIKDASLVTESVDESDEYLKLMTDHSKRFNRVK
jgi:hypothetical protein